MVYWTTHDERHNHTTVLIADRRRSDNRWKTYGGHHSKPPFSKKKKKIDIKFFTEKFPSVTDLVPYTCSTEKNKIKSECKQSDISRNIRIGGRKRRENPECVIELLRHLFGEVTSCPRRAITPTRANVPCNTC